MKTEIYKSLMNLVNQNAEFINQTKSEKFKDDWIIVLVLSNVLLNIRIGDSIIVEVNNSMHQYLLDFNKNEKTFKTFDDFKTFFDGIINGIKESTQGLFATYKGEEYLCEIEATSVDPNRQMGPETIYEVSFTDHDGETIIVAEISEYPIGSYTIFERNSDVDINDSDVISYFYSEDDE